MDNKFEKRFSELQADMVSVCLEYCAHQCEQVFLHVINEDESIFTNFFFRADGIMRKKSDLPGAAAPVSIERQKAALSAITQAARSAGKLCEAYGRPLPTEYRLVYDVAAGSLRAEYSYDPITSADKSCRAVSEDWFRQQAARRA
ncbi:MAG: hypothetical protein FWC27_11540 [Firmicutes bacterium]|nr:hypothetical protein [Bacillota bacterium]